MFKTKKKPLKSLRELASRELESGRNKSGKSHCSKKTLRTLWHLLSLITKLEANFKLQSGKKYSQKYWVNQKVHWGFFHNIVQKTPNKLFGQPNI